MTKQKRHPRPNVRLQKSDRDRAVESYIARLRSMGPDKVLAQRIDKLEQEHRSASK